MQVDIIELIDETLAIISAIKAVPRWQRQAEARLSRKIGGLMGGAMRAATAELIRRGVPSSDLTRAQLILPLADAEEDIISAVQQAALEAAKHGRNRAIDEMRKLGLTVPTPGDLPDEIARRLRSNVFEASRRTLARVRGNVLGKLAEASEQGLGIDDAADMLRDVTENLRDYESQRIARTEIQNTQSEAAHDTMKEMGVQYEKWVAAEDGRTRDSHDDVSGEITSIDGTFSNGLLHPGDRNGPIEEWVNCRCRSVPFIMPRGKSPPPGKDIFREHEII